MARSTFLRRADHTQTINHSQEEEDVESTVVSDFIRNSFGCQDTHMQTTGWGVNTRELHVYTGVDAGGLQDHMKAENHSGVIHEELIPIWEYSNNVFQKLLMIYVFTFLRYAVFI